MEPITVSTPSRLCLFGEHQDYLHLEVIAAAIDLRFYANIERRNDKLVHVQIISDIFSMTPEEHNDHSPYHEWIDLSKPIVYDHSRDYLKSSINTLLENGWVPKSGYEITMYSEIPIGKGMSSSTTMILAFIKALAEIEDAPFKNDSKFIADLGFHAEVSAFNEPGGKMDHLTSSLGGMQHLNFAASQPITKALEAHLQGVFLLFDSLADKDTTKVLKNAKDPVVKGLTLLKEMGIDSFRSLSIAPNRNELLANLPAEIQNKLKAQLANDHIRQKALALLSKKNFDPKRFGELLSEEHAILRDGLGLSTPAIETILDTALSLGAYGGKINGSGGGGCCFVYADKTLAKIILQEVSNLGYPGHILTIDTGIRREKNA